MDKKYNGWANYATWRIQLEIIEDYVRVLAEDISAGHYDDFDWSDSSVVSDTLKDYVEEVLGLNVEDDYTLVKSYASAFIDDVDWYELAKHAQEYLDKNAGQFTTCGECEKWGIEIIDGMADSYCRDCQLAVCDECDKYDSFILLTDSQVCEDCTKRNHNKVKGVK